MNILEFCFSNAWGGLEIYVTTFANEFKKRENNIIGVVNSNSRLEAAFRNNSIEQLAVDKKIKYLDLVTAIKTRSFLNKKNIDIIHIHQSKDLSTAILLNKLLKSSKIVFTQHMDSKYNKKDLYHKWIYNNLDHVVSMTESMKQNHITHTPVRESQISVIYSGIDLERFASHKSVDKKSFLLKNNIPQDKIIIGTVGRLDKLKNQELLIDAAKLLVEKNPNIYFIIIGDETDSITGKGYKQKLVDKIRYLGIDNSVSFFGFTNNIENYFDVMDIFVLPTDKESFGYVLIEAMAKGIPVLATNQGGPKEIIIDNKNGYLFDPNNVSDLTEKLLLLINDSTLRGDMGEASKKIAKSRFDVNVTIDNYIKLFERLLKD